MARPSLVEEKRKELLPIVARAFTELGYRRATTAELAQRCGVGENVLYRLWPDKKAMFLAAIDFVYEFAEQTWRGVAERKASATSPALQLLDFEAGHHGEFGHYRILFMGLSESEDPDIRGALKRVFGRFHRFLKQQILAHQKLSNADPALPAEVASWAFVGLGTVLNISRELGLLTSNGRSVLMRSVGQLLLANDES